MIYNKPDMLPLLGKYRLLSPLGGFFFLMLLLFGFGLSEQAKGQSQELTVDEQYSLARQAAFDENDYSKARKIAYDALQKSPDYHGIRIFIARLYGWEGNYKSARKELETVLNRDPDNREAFKALTTIESRSGHLDRALQVNSKALDQFPKDEELLLQRASVLYSFEEYSRSEQVYKSIMVVKPGSIEAREGLKSARLMQLKHTASVSYRHDSFGERFEPWRFWDVQLSRQTRYGSIIGNVQYANRFSTNGAQFNLDAYPSIASGFYAYVSAGLSNSDIHPRFRFGLSLYKSLPKAFEAEAGMRYLNFTVSETYIYTGSLTKYLGSYMVTGRTYFIPASTGNSLSGNILIRRYLGSAEKYVSLSGGYGSASNDIQFAQEVNTLNSWSLSLDSQYPVGKRFLISGTVGIDSEEFRSYTRDRFSFKAGFSYRF
jgi:YaiO family outer membrane protein